MATDTKLLKNLLHESIERVDDEELLQMVKDVLDRKYEITGITLTEYQEQRLEKANESAANGETMTNDQADELVSQWLKE